MTVVVCLLNASIASAAEPGRGDDPLELFNQRILPIFRSPEPSSCVQCHLAAVDLKNYILPSHEQTFVSLRDQGLIDVDRPEQSKILTLIRMGDADLDEGPKLIHAKMRRAEEAAFAAWIKACCSDPRLRNLPSLEPQSVARPARPDEVIRHARRNRVVESFVRNVWSQRLRCFPCHTPHDIDPTNNQHQAAVKKHRELLDQYPELADRLDIFQSTPEATVQYLIERSQKVAPGELPVINLADPAQSLLVLKPTSKLPAKDASGRFVPASASLPVSHMGGLKMHRDDVSYKSFMAWINDYANVVGDRYVAVDDLPADNWHPTKHVLRLTDAPADWAEGLVVQMFLHEWDPKAESWGARPLGFTQGVITPRRMVNGTVVLLGGGGGEADASIATLESPEATKYLVKVYVDRRGRVAADPTLLLGEDDLAGQVELQIGRWREGFQQAKQISGRTLTH